MANANTQVDLDALMDVIETAIKTRFPVLKSVEFDREETSPPPSAPACLLELTEGELYQEQDPGTEQLPFSARFEARFLVAFNTPRPARECRKLALAFAAWMHQRTWRKDGVPGGPAAIIGAYKDEFSPELEKFEVWRVEWTQELHLGESVWTETGTTHTPELAVRIDAVPTYTQGVDLSIPVKDGIHHPVGEYVPLSEAGA
jgi:hypothetical protein